MCEERMPEQTLLRSSKHKSTLNYRYRNSVASLLDPACSFYNGLLVIRVGRFKKCIQLVLKLDNCLARPHQLHREVSLHRDNEPN